jgi:peptidoglycan/xylan/chitin deacetylase (PgdA/CDA1 family)
MTNPWSRAGRYIQRNAARYVFQRTQAIRLSRPIISFTFDDFPRTALFEGGAILKSFGATGTYYAALGLMGKDSPSGPVCIREDLVTALAEGHELGCHTYAHCHSWETRPQVFEDSVCKNSEVLREIVPNAHFASFSYPLSEPHPFTKRAVAKHFDCCRAGGQTLNSGRTDLNQLSSFFLEQAYGGLDEIKALIDRNRDERGWIIFSTHDVAAQPSRYGCTSDLFRAVVDYSLQSGAEVLSVAQALSAVRTASAA